MSEFSVKLHGYPEKVQLIADALEEAFPGTFAWTQSEDEADGIAIKIDGYEIPSKPLRRSRQQAA